MWHPWVGSLYESEGYRGRRILILGESHYGGDGCHYPEVTREGIQDMALKKGHLPFFSRTQRIIVGGRGGFTSEERHDFWHRVAFANYVQTALERPGSRPSWEMWSAASEQFLRTVEELRPDVIVALGIELGRNLPKVPDGVTLCVVQHPSSIGFTYEPWQERVASALTPGNG